MIEMLETTVNHMNIRMKYVIFHKPMALLTNSIVNNDNKIIVITVNRSSINEVELYFSHIFFP